ncbi:MAG TPA: beta-propeller fold lactonase family protein [Verrucomicrobiae bacterium]|nr:beta-propeller fold lactonase family protein [Verrucomicrobiae bacterium]
MKRVFAGIFWCSVLVFAAAAADTYLVCVSNEGSGDVSIIDPIKQEVVASVPVGKRPRGIQGSPDGRLLYVAVSGTPNLGPPKLDPQGNPIFDKKAETKNTDSAADGIAVLDLLARKLVKKLPASTDPEQFALGANGRKLYIANEDAATLSILNVDYGDVEHVIPVHEEPEGVAVSPDGRYVYVTCETRGEICVIDARNSRKVAEFTVGGRPRNVALLPDSSRAFIPSESSGKIHVVDVARHEVLQTIALPGGSRPMDVKIGRDGKKLYVSNGRAGTISVIDTHTLRVLNTIKVGVRPWGLGLSPDGKLLYVANGPSNDVTTIDLNTETEIKRVRVGQSPWGIAIVRKLPDANPSAAF